MRKLYLVFIAFILCILPLILTAGAFNDSQAKRCTEVSYKILVIDNYFVENIQISSPLESGKAALIVVTPKTKTKDDVRWAGWAAIASFEVLQARYPEVIIGIISIRYYGDEYKLMITPEDLIQARVDGKVDSVEIFEILDKLIQKNS